MKVEAHIVILLKRVHQLERIIEALVTVVGDNCEQLSDEERTAATPGQVLEAKSQLFGCGVPFDPNCSNCKHELEIINEGTFWESFNCPNCEAWYFPRVG